MNTEFVEVPVIDEVDGQDLKQYFQELIGHRGDGELARALDLVVDPHDARMTVESVTLTDVCASSDGITLDYKVGAQAYYGCSDQDSFGTHEASIEGQRIGDVWQFKVFKYPEPLSPDEEL